MFFGKCDVEIRINEKKILLKMKSCNSYQLHEIRVKCIEVGGTPRPSSDSEYQQPITYTSRRYGIEQSPDDCL